MKKQVGFTLIEIAIVLVIIGLLLGGVLKGQELINTARVRALNNSVDGVTAAWFSFQDRYRAYPGDYSTAQASINLPGVTLGGNANGQVSTNAERAMVWVHLEAAGYITGGYNNAAATIATTQYFDNPTSVSPDNGFGTGMVLTYASQDQATTVNAHELISGHGIPVEVLAELDRKVDDGQPITGSMQVATGGTTWATTDSALCTVTTGTAPNTVTSYQLQTPSPNCASVFRNF